LTRAAGPEDDRSALTTIAPKSGHALVVERGRKLKIVDVEGQQVSDLVWFSRADPTEFFSQARTRVYNWSTRMTTGSKLYSNRNRALATIVEDTVGVHDVMFTGCSRYVYEHLLEVGPQNGCIDNLTAAVAAFGIEPHLLPDPFNIFMNTSVGPDGGLSIGPSPSRPGDHLVLEAHEDLIVALTSCADDVTDCNGGVCTPLEVEVI
jgi:uncharacterized protein